MAEASSTRSCAALAFAATSFAMLGFASAASGQDGTTAIALDCDETFQLLLQHY